MYSPLVLISLILFFFFFNATATTEIYTLSLHDALPISLGPLAIGLLPGREDRRLVCQVRSEEHTSELQSRFDLVCRLLLEKKKKGWSLSCGAEPRVRASRRRGIIGWI